MRLVFSIFIICNLLTLSLFYFDSFLHFYHQDQNDVFMDFFNVFIHSIHSSYYSIFHSIYPPLNFLLLDYITQFNKDFLNVPYIEGNVILREMFGTEIFFFATFYIVSSIYYFILFSKVEVSKKKYLFIICCISSPVIYLIERMNIIFIIFPLFFALLNKDTKDFKSALYLAIIINIKIYFIILMLFLRLRAFFLTCILSLVIGFFSLIFIDEDFATLDILINFFNFSKDLSISSFFTHNYSLFSFTATLNSIKFSDIFFKFFEVKISNQFFLIFFQANIIKIIFFTLLFLLSIKYDHQKRIIIGYLTILTLLPEVGGYIGILILPILIYVIENYKNNRYYNILTLLLFLLILPIDFNIYNISHTHGFSFYFGKFVSREIYLSLYQVLRPILVLTILYYFLRSFKKINKSFIN